jgi:hypothetical protein
VSDDLGVHRRQVVLYRGGSVDWSIVSVEISVAGGHVRSLLLQDLHKPVQGRPDEHTVDHGPLGDVIGEDFTLRIEEDQNSLFFLRRMDFCLKLTCLSYP